MNNADLVLRTQRLLVRSTLLRHTLADQVQVLEKPLALVDKAQAGLQWLLRNPHWPAAAVLGMLILRPKRALVWSGRIWWVWKTFQLSKK